MFSVYIESACDDASAVLARSEFSFPTVSRQNRCQEFKQSSEDRLNGTPETRVSHPMMERLPPIREPPTRHTANEVLDIAKKPWKDLYSSPLAKRRPDAATASTVASTSSSLKQQREALKYKSRTRDEPADSKFRHPRLKTGTVRPEKSLESHLSGTSGQAEFPDRGVLQDVHVLPDERKTGIKQVHHGPIRTVSYLERTMQRKESMRSRSENKMIPIVKRNSCIEIAKGTVVPLSSRSRFSTVSVMSGCSSRRIRLKAPTSSGIDIHS